MDKPTEICEHDDCIRVAIMTIIPTQQHYCEKHAEQGLQKYFKSVELGKEQKAILEAERGERMTR